MMMHVDSTAPYSAHRFSSRHPFYIKGKKLHGDGAQTSPAPPINLIPGSKALNDGAKSDKHPSYFLQPITDHDQLKGVRDHLRHKMRAAAQKANSASQEPLTKALALSLLMEDPDAFLKAVEKSPQWFRDAMQVKEAAQVFVFSPKLHRSFGLRFPKLGWEFLTENPLNAKQYGLSVTA